MKRVLAAATGRDALMGRVQSRVGPPTTTDGPAAQLRRFYTNNYGALDRFDRLWYEMRFLERPHDWESHFVWSLLHTAVVNARAAWCAAHNERLPLMTFLQRLIASYGDSLSK